jgi:hypothetical protein
MSRSTRIPDANRPENGVWWPKHRHFMPDAPSSRAPDASIKPHGARHQGAGMNKELEAYPKCL